MFDFVTIDGLSATGKTTLGRRLSAALSWGYWDSGLLFRACHLVRLGTGMVPSGADLGRFIMTPGIGFVTPCQVRFGGEDLTGALFGPGIDGDLSRTASEPRIRAWVADYLTVIADRNSIVLGRDTASYRWNVEPLRVRLVADDQVRLERRKHQDGSGSAIHTATTREPHAVALASDIGPLDYDMVLRSDKLDVDLLFATVSTALRGAGHQHQQ